MQISKYSIFILFLLFGCKTINLNEDLDSAEIPADIELIKIPKGFYISGKSNELNVIAYDYFTMKYPVTNAQYVNYLIESFNAGHIIINSDSVMGYYPGDKNWPPGNYLFLDLDDPDCRIAFFPPDIFYIYEVYLGPDENFHEFYDDHPVTEITWFGANAFASHYGLKLPTVEEWEKAARANTGYIYSWGNSLDSLNGNFFNSGDKFDNGTTPVGYYNGSNNTNNSPSPYGIYDMTGNVWEWTNSWKGESPSKIIKGGSWESRSDVIFSSSFGTGFSELHTWFTHPVNGYSPTNSSHSVGFRCVIRD